MPATITLNCFKLCFALQIDLAVAGKHVIEQTNLIGNAMRPELVTSGRQDDWSPHAALLCIQKVNNLRSVGQPGYIRGNALSHPLFEVSSAPSRPEDQTKRNE